MTDVPITGGGTQTFDLEDPFYLLVAEGPMGSRGESPELLQHDEKIASSDPARLTSVERIGAAKNWHAKLHGCLMVLAWYLLGSCGIFTARYCKNAFAGRTACGKDIWFRVHQLAMTAVWLITLSSVVVLVVEYGFDPLSSQAIDANPHSLIGIICTALMFVQPFMALARPHPGTPRRPIFNRVHSAIGLAAKVLASVAVLFATEDTFVRVDLAATPARAVAIAFQVRISVVPLL